MWYQTKKCSTLCRVGHFIGQVENVWSHTRPFSKEFQQNLFHSQTSIKITFYIFTFFSLWNWGNCTLYRLSVTAASCSHLFMGKLHRLRWKARYSFTQKAVSCKLPNFPTFCPQLSFLPLESQRAASGRWKLSINTNSVKYGPSNTQTGWALKKYQVLGT